MNNYNIGALVRVATVFADSTGAALNPTVVKFTYKPLALGTATTLTYGTDTALVRDSTGNYHVDLDTTLYGGTWNWRFYSTGTGQSSEEGSFYVTPNAAVTSTVTASGLTDLSASSGSNLIGFIDGRTGAIARTVQDELRDLRVSIKRFGAVGDGSHNDTSGFALADIAMKTLGGDGVLYIPPGIYMVDPDTLTNFQGDYPIRVEGNQGSLFPTNLTRGTIIRARAAGTTLVTMSGNYRSVADIVFDGAGLVANTVLMAPTTSHYDFERCAFVRPIVTTGLCFNATNGGNGQIDHMWFKDCLFHGDPVASAARAVGLRLGGTNATLNTMENCHFYSVITGLDVNSGSISPKKCDFAYITGACIKLRGDLNTMRIEDCYTESTTTTFFIDHSVTTATTNATLFVIGNQMQSTANKNAFSTGQRLILMGNQWSGTVTVDSTNRFRPLAIGNNFNGTANDYTGAGASNVDKLSDDVSGTQYTTILDNFTAATTVLGGTNITGGVTYSSIISPTALSGTTSDYAPTGGTTARTFRLLPTGGPYNLTGIAGGTAGRSLRVMNVSVVGGENIVFKHDATSTAANRFYGPNLADVTLRPGGAVDLDYDGTASRWRILGA